MNEPDDQLLRRYIQNDDRSAMDELVRRHIDMVYATARRQLQRNEHAADDVTQAVFMLLLRKAKSVHRGQLAGWLLQTTRYACANARKILARRVLHEMQAAEQRTEAVVFPTNNPLLLNLDKGIAALRAGEREVLILKYLEGRELTDISTLLGITQIACRKRITRAIDHLRRRLSPKATDLIGEAALLAVLQTVSNVNTSPPVHIELATTSPHPFASEIFKETAMFLKWIQIKNIAAVLVMCFVMLGVAGEISRRAYAEKPSTNPIETKSSQINVSPATQPQPAISDLQHNQKNLLNIGQAISRYAQRHNGHLPDSLGQTMQYIQPWSEWTKAFQPKATPVEKAAFYISPADLKTISIPNNPTPQWVDDHTSYVYLGNGNISLKDIAGDEMSKTATVHAKLNAGDPVVGTDGTQVTVFCILMLDGRVDAEKRDYVEGVISDSKKTFAGEK
jgi:RNA polymerase sigma factor (sigma-70 family)